MLQHFQTPFTVHRSFTDISMIFDFVKYYKIIIIINIHCVCVLSIFMVQFSYLVRIFSQASFFS